MKNTYLSLLLLVFCLTACQKNSDVIETNSETPTPALVTTVDLEWRASVVEEESVRRWRDNIGTQTILQHVSVKLMFMGDVLWESNTDRFGTFEMPEQPVPAEGAYFLFEAPGYYNNVVAVESDVIPIWRLNMMPIPSPDIQGEIITDAESYITLTGQLQDPSTARGYWLYLTNAADELVGTMTISPEDPNFYLTTLPDEDLFLHYNVECGGDGVIPLGSFSESTDIGVLLDQSFDFSHDWDLVYLDNVTDSAGDKLYGYDLFYKEDNLTFQAGGNSGVQVRDCQPMGYPILLSVATQDPRKYVEFSITHTPGQQTDIPDQMVTEDDDTFLQFIVGNDPTNGGEFFTYANILPDGRMVLKQTSINPNEYKNKFALVIDGNTTGSHNSNANVEITKYTPSGTSSWSWDYENSFGGYEINTAITMNDGTFVEGTFSGEVLDKEEVSLGVLEGSFRARIQ